MRASSILMALGLGVVPAFGCGASGSPDAASADAATADAAMDSAPLGDATIADGTPPADADPPFDGSLSDGQPPGEDARDASAAPCVERNAPAQVMARDGFIEVCPTGNSRAVCGDGTPYRFSYRPAMGPSAGLLVYFRGGGNCTDYLTCWGRDGMGGPGRTVGTLSNERTSPEILPALGRTFGLFDRADPTALFADFDVLYLPYCSGDGGLQSSEQTFARPPGADPSAPPMITTYFRGIDNRQAALAWAVTRFARPARLMVWGSSAGSYASIGAIPEVVAAWPAVRDVTWWGEGGVGVGRPSFSALVDDTIARFDGAASRPLVRFVQFSYASDATQRQFAPAPFNADEPAFRGEVRRLVEARAARHPNHYRYVVPAGTCHTLALEPSLYQAFRRVGTGWQPVMPAVRPNPELVFSGVSLVTLIRQVSRGTGAFDASLANIAPDGSTANTRCEIVRGDAM
jgi:hypothetical protein